MPQFFNASFVQTHYKTNLYSLNFTSFPLDCLKFPYVTLLNEFEFLELLQVVQLGLFSSDLLNPGHCINMKNTLLE